jgi:redox-sensitive bicupin YhaK (pirin superfamily)
MGFGVLRVLNDDEIAGGAGFPKHHHANMEIITIVTSGGVAHVDSVGNRGVVNAGDVQVMSAGSGVYHSEVNASKDEPLTLFQIWILPNKQNVLARYDQKHFGEQKENSLELLVAGENADAPLFIYQDAFIYRGALLSNKTISHTLSSNKNGVYIFVIEGELLINDVQLFSRDALGVSDTQSVTLEAKTNTTFLLFEIPLSLH